MVRLASVRWQSPPPTSIDEELVAYDDGTAWLVIRSPRDGGGIIGTWSATPPPHDHAALVAGGDMVVDLLHPQLVPEPVERVRAAAFANPVATAQFLAAVGGATTVALAALGAGTRPVQFELDPDSLTVHLQPDGGTVTWSDAAWPITGFVTPEAVGLGGLGRRAQIQPGDFGAIALEVPGLTAEAGTDVVVQLAGWLADGLPDEDLPRRFQVRTVPGDRIEG